jgi:hypothetical protein
VLISSVSKVIPDPSISNIVLPLPLNLIDQGSIIIILPRVAKNYFKFQVYLKLTASMSMIL